MFAAEPLRNECVAKYYEREQDVPPLSKLEEITQDRLPNKTVLTYEMWIVSRIDWDVGAYCAQHFLDFYIAVGMFCEGDIFTDPQLEQDPSGPPLYASKLAEHCVLGTHDALSSLIYMYIFQPGQELFYVSFN